MPSDERREFGRRARERIVRDYNIDVIIRRYEALYEGVAAEISRECSFPSSR